LPSDEARFSVKTGDLVKLIFRYRDHVEINGRIVTAEHMWIRVTGCGEGYLIGRLDNDPQYTSLLRYDGEVNFHPKHIINLWTD